MSTVSSWDPLPRSTASARHPPSSSSSSSSDSSPLPLRRSAMDVKGGCDELPTMCIPLMLLAIGVGEPTISTPENIESVSDSVPDNGPPGVVGFWICHRA